MIVSTAAPSELCHLVLPAMRERKAARFATSLDRAFHPAEHGGLLRDQGVRALLHRGPATRLQGSGIASRRYARADDDGSRGGRFAQPDAGTMKGPADAVVRGPRPRTHRRGNTRPRNKIPPARPFPDPPAMRRIVGRIRLAKADRHSALKSHPPGRGELVGVFGVQRTSCLSLPSRG